MRCHFLLTKGSAGLKVRLYYLRKSLHQQNKGERNASRLVSARWICVCACAAHPSLLSPTLSLKCCSLVRLSREQLQWSLWLKKHSEFRPGARGHGSLRQLKDSSPTALKIIVCPPKQAVIRPHRPVNKNASRKLTECAKIENKSF